jgi:hypothetical protein
MDLGALKRELCHMLNADTLGDSERCAMAGKAFNKIIKGAVNVDQAYAKVGDCFVCAGKHIYQTMDGGINTHADAHERIVAFNKAWGVAAGCEKAINNPEEGISHALFRQEPTGMVLEHIGNYLKIDLRDAYIALMKYNKD